MRIIPLSEGAFTVDASKKFIPFDKEIDELTNRNRGSLLVEIQPFLIITSKDLILLDAGLGLNDENGQIQLYQNLRQHGFNVDDVTKVVMSHLHKDHAGGLFNPYTRQLSFEHATYHIQKQELEFSLQKNSSSYDSEILEHLKNFDNVILEEDEKGSIDDMISYEVTGAHSKFHRVIWIKEEDETIFFGGDDAPQLSQMKTRFAAKYDYDGKKAMQLRDAWLEMGADWKFLFYHDIKTPVLNLKKQQV
ncbi:MAG TPA: MBL fold metallo-hydrolase [Niabella sp.]|nr:MBL fold metallo-hydrolase [Niabella sp.]HQW14264.1 MBL fold metallo-hydrolase [Niabella sp.]HQX19664.1 MBL fold metallo-hydrolase [Niabella sp.]HRB06895.1 MBL fold metallo-hydrolase [Niabella sp.]HRB36703.1 MBL fold metallo-hydrolase [Niabella sp.]